MLWLDCSVIFLCLRLSFVLNVYSFSSVAQWGLWAADLHWEDVAGLHLGVGKVAETVWPPSLLSGWPQSASELSAFLGFNCFHRYVLPSTSLPLDYITWCFNQAYTSLCIQTHWHTHTHTHMHTLTFLSIALPIWLCLRWKEISAYLVGCALPRIACRLKGSNLPCVVF